jgi:DNA processing protein
MEKCLAAVALLQLPGIGVRKARKLLEPGFYPNTAQDFHESLSSLTLVKGSHITQAVASAAIQAWAEAEQIVSSSLQAGIQVISILDSRYPSLLREVDDAPIVLYLKGAIDFANAKLCVAVVGTRKPTEFGTKFAEQIGYHLANLDVPVVSGLAIGCDTFAHLGCLRGSGKAVAVLAHGLDHVAPRQNLRLAAEIVDSGGCLVSEYPLGVLPSKSTFVARDRIQSGLSAAVIVVESTLGGGSLHTADSCVKQGRRLATVAHPLELLHQDSARGNQFLIEQRQAKSISTMEELHAFVRLLSENNQSVNHTPSQLQLF